jgi:ATP-binding cassette subfamily D (ALD) long-chain fatty acid import protein
MANLSKPFRSLPPSSRAPLIVLLATILLLRSRLISIPKDALTKLKSVAQGKRLSPEELVEALKQIYVNEDDGSKTLLVPYRDSVSKVGN